MTPSRSCVAAVPSGLRWVTNALYPKLGTPQEYNDRIGLEIRCVRGDPRPSEIYSIEQLKAMGFYGLYKEVP